MKTEKKLRVVIAVMLGILALPVQSWCTQNLVTNSGFETVVNTYGTWPTSYGYWEGDYSAIVGTTSGITPFEGSHMLRFIGTSWTTASSSAGASEMMYLIDLSPFSSLIASGHANASASAYFNRIAGDAQTDSAFYLGIFARQDSPAYNINYTGDGQVLSSADNFFNSDSNPATWERINAQMLIPTNATYLVIRLAAQENIYNDTSGLEFDGHFADQVSLEITPEPATLLLLGMGGLILRKHK